VNAPCFHGIEKGLLQLLLTNKQITHLCYKHK